MPPRKKAAPDADEAQTTAPSEDQVLAAAQGMRMNYHEERGNNDPKPWEDLAPEKQQRWLDLAAGKGE